MSLRHQTAGYRIDALIARGRSGEVHRATASDGRLVAFKIHDDPDVGRRETAALATVDHPSVVGLLDHGALDDGRLWLALPWIDGRTLAQLLAAEGPLDEHRARRLLRQLAAALDATHDAGVVHGDLSPRNVLVDLNDQVTLIDFGSSGPAGPEAPRSEATAEIGLHATLRYAAPEVLLGEPPRPASDRYALGVLAHEMLTGGFPFPEVETAIEMVRHHATTEPTPPSELRPSVSAATDAALLAALSKDPSERPTTAVAMLDAFDRPADRDGTVRSLRLAALPVAAVVALLLAFAALGGDDDDVDEPGDEVAAVGDGAWAAGTAAGRSCNLLQVPGFEQSALPDTYYSGDPTNTVSLVPGAGVDGSAALRVGASGAFGLFAEIVPLGAERDVVFSGWVRRFGEPATTAFYVEYLDENFEQITFTREEAMQRPPVGDAEGRRVTVRSTAPADAAFALPTVFKDGSPGSLLVDEMVFGVDGACGVEGG